MLCSGPPLEPPFAVGRPAGPADGVVIGRLLGEIDLAATPAAVRLARSYMRELVAEYFTVDRFGLGDLELLTSEAVTHSVVHAQPRRDGTILLSALVIDRLIRVEITGGSSRGEPQEPQEPRMWPVLEALGDPAEWLAPVAGDGRAWCLFKALATGYGAYGNTDGTVTFWFEMAVSGR